VIVVDSSVLIPFVRRDGAVVEWLRGLQEEGEELATTSISKAELLRGAHATPAVLATVARLLDGFVEVPFGPRAARRFGRLMFDLDRAGRRMPDIDGLVAAATLESGARLATRDAVYRRVPGLDLVEPPA
jgi:predicted nucleic acid-binding protein